MAVCSILYQLATRPEEQEKIHQELVKILPDPNVPLTNSHLNKAVYLKAFIREVFRYKLCSLFIFKIIFLNFSLNFKFVLKNTNVFFQSIFHRHR